MTEIKIPFLDLKAPSMELKDQLDAAYQRVLQSGWYILGAELEAFESEFAAFCGARQAAGVANGLDALELGLRALGVGEGDEVIVPSNTYIATWLAISRVGARIVPVEPDPLTYNLDPERVEAAVTPRSRVLLPVHLYGQSCQMEDLGSIAEKYHLDILEDSAQMHLRGRSPMANPNLRVISAYSFYPTKNLGALGDAGAVVTHDADLADKVRVLRNYGSRKRYYNEVIGQNSRMDPLQAAFLKVKLAVLEDWNARRERIAAYYCETLAGLPGLTLPHAAQGAVHGWHIFAVRHTNRDALQAHLTQAGIGTLVHYPVPPHLSEAYRHLGWQHGDFPISEKLAETELSLPIGPHLSMEQAEAVARAIREFC